MSGTDPVTGFQVSNPAKADGSSSAPASGSTKAQTVNTETGLPIGGAVGANDGKTRPQEVDSVTGMPKSETQKALEAGKAAPNPTGPKGPITTPNNPQRSGVSNTPPAPVGSAADRMQKQGASAGAVPGTADPALSDTLSKDPIDDQALVNANKAGSKTGNLDTGHTNIDRNGQPFDVGYVDHPKYGGTGQPVAAPTGHQRWPSSHAEAYFQNEWLPKYEASLVGFSRAQLEEKVQGLLADKRTAEPGVTERAAQIAAIRRVQATLKP